MKSYHWDKNSRYCESIKCNCKICKLTSDKKNCTIKDDVKHIKEKYGDKDNRME